jgi:hypothetical protein
MKLANCKSEQLFDELAALHSFLGENARKQRFEWLRMLGANEKFYEGDFVAEQTSSSRHPANWIIALALRMPAAPKGEEKALDWYARTLLGEDEYAKTGKHLSGTNRLAEFLKLNRETVGDWERARLSDSEESYLADRETHELLQNVVRALLRERHPIPLTVAFEEEEEGRRNRQRPAAALLAGLRYLLFYPCVHRNALCLVAWPYRKLGLTAQELEAQEVFSDAEMAEAARPRLPDLPTPLAQVPSKQWTAPRIPQDIFCSLQAVRAQTLQVKTDGLLYAKSAKAVAEGLAPLPSWLRLKSEARVQIALSMAWNMGWVKVRGRGRQSVIETTPAAESWLRLPQAQRNLLLLDRLRDPSALQHDARPSFFTNLPFAVDSKKARTARKPFGEEVRDYLREFWQRLEEGVFYEMEALLDKAGACQHPFRQRQIYMGSSDYRSRVPSLQVDDLWAGFLKKFCFHPLVDYGGATLGFHEDKLCIALTATGRYLLGLVDELELAEETGRVVLQPNFELVFMEPSPEALASLAPYCRRVSEGQLGTLLRLDRMAILNAVRLGADTEAILADLQRYTDGVPDNVAAEVRSWCDSTMRVWTSRLTVIDCSDKHNAMRVLAAASNYLAPLTDTVLKLKPGTKNTELSKALAKHGIFLNQ